jgi:hypothetical protein
MSPNWDSGAVVDAGAATFGNGFTGISGAVGAANSLVGNTTGDQIGDGGATALSNGNYVVRSLSWDNGAIVDAGAATFGNGAVGISGTVSPANSLVGSTNGDLRGPAVAVVTELSNGNYLVRSPAWDNGAIVNAGAVTFGSGATGVSGAIGVANSLVGSTAGDQVGRGVALLSNGNYAVISRNWDNGAIVNAGAVTFGSGATGIAGAVTSANSAVGAAANANLQFVVVDQGNNSFLATFLDEAGGKVRAGSQLDGFTYTTTTTLTASPQATTGGTLVTFTAKAAVAGGAIPTGSVNFYDNGVLMPLGTNVPLNAGGFASFQSSLPVGTHPITANYLGAAGFVASSSSAVNVAIAATLPITVSSVTVNGDFIPITAASEAGNTVTLTAGGHSGFSAGNTIIVAGFSGANAGYNGTFTIVSVTPNGPKDLITYVSSVAGLGAVSNNTAAYALSANTASSLQPGPGDLHQRSVVDSVVYVFNQAVNVTSSTFQIALTPGITVFDGGVTTANTTFGTPPTPVASTIDGGLTWIVTFSGTAGNFRSIADGVYNITLDNTQVSATFGAGTLSASRTDTFYRLFGDRDATGATKSVGNSDANSFSPTFNNAANYNPAFDFSGDGSIGNADANPFSQRFNKRRFSAFTPTI